MGKHLIRGGGLSGDTGLGLALTLILTQPVSVQSRTSSPAQLVTVSLNRAAAALQPEDGPSRQTAINTTVYLYNTVESAHSQRG